MPFNPAPGVSQRICTSAASVQPSLRICSKEFGSSGTSLTRSPDISKLRPSRQRVGDATGTL